MVGAGKVIAVDVLPQKLAWAEDWGDCVDAPRRRIRRADPPLAGGGGVDFAFEVVGMRSDRASAALDTPRRHDGGVGVCRRAAVVDPMFLQQRVLPARRSAVAGNGPTSPC